MFFEGKEVKNVWLKLRGSYRDARRRQHKRVKSGISPKNIKPWRHQKQMSFLEPYTSIGADEGNMIDDGSDADSQQLLESPKSEHLENGGVDSENEKEVNSQLQSVGYAPHVDNITLDDPLYNFFISMYQLTKNMPPNYQHKVRSQVFQAVSESEAAIMNIASDSSLSIFPFSKDEKKSNNH
uniref:BESS domain-containing protein n=1 Tax=Rhodnius prolixus TaxID=13249 RepID=T1IA17_RHOPR